MIYQELVSYLKAALLDGRGLDGVKNELLTTGWQIADIDEAWHEVQTSMKSGVSNAGEQVVKIKDIKGKAITVLSILGALLIGAGVIMFFASNWQDIPRMARVAIVFAVLLLSYGAGDYLISNKDFPRVGKTFIFLGTLFFGVAIILIAQLFNILSENSNTFLYWSLLILPIAYVYRLESSLVLATVLLFTWFMFKSRGGVDLEVLFSSARGSDSGISFYYPIFSLIFILPMAYVIRSGKSIFFALIGLALWLNLTFWQMFGADVFGSYYLNFAKVELLALLLQVAFAALAIGISYWHRVKAGFEHMEKAFFSFGFISILIFVFAVSMKSFNRGLSYYGFSRNIKEVALSPEHFTLPILVLSMALFVHIFFYVKNRADLNMILRESWIYVMVIGFFLAKILVPSSNGSAQLFLWLLNLQLFVFVTWFILYGMSKKSKIMINVGTAIFALIIFIKYFELGYDLLDGSAFFISTGIVLIGVSVAVERQRKRLILALNNNQ